MAVNGTSDIAVMLFTETSRITNILAPIFFLAKTVYSNVLGSTDDHIENVKSMLTYFVIIKGMEFLLPYILDYPIQLHEYMANINGGDLDRMVSNSIEGISTGMSWYIKSLNFITEVVYVIGEAFMNLAFYLLAVMGPLIILLSVMAGLGVGIKLYISVLFICASWPIIFAALDLFTVKFLMENKGIMALMGGLLAATMKILGPMGLLATALKSPVMGKAVGATLGKIGGVGATAPSLAGIKESVANTGDNMKNSFQKLSSDGAGAFNSSGLPSSSPMSRSDMRDTMKDAGQSTGQNDTKRNNDNAQKMLDKKRNETPKEELKNKEDNKDKNDPKKNEDLKREQEKLNSSQSGQGSGGSTDSKSISNNMSSNSSFNNSSNQSSNSSGSSSNNSSNSIGGSNSNHTTSSVGGTNSNSSSNSVGGTNSSNSSNSAIGPSSNNSNTESSQSIDNRKNSSQQKNTPAEKSTDNSEDDFSAGHLQKKRNR